MSTPNQNIQIHNKFEFEVRDSLTGKLRQTAVSYNIVLGQCFTRLINRSSKFGYMHIGTGTGTLDIARNALFTFLGSRSCTVVETDYAYPTSWIRRKIVLAPADFVGEIITEVGLAYGSSASSLCTHSLLQDSEGNPISIQKTDTDVVTIYSTVYASIGNFENDYWILPSPGNNAVLKGILADSYTAPKVYLGQWGAQAGDGFQTADVLGYVFSNDSNLDFIMATGGKTYDFSGDAVNNKWVFAAKRWDYNENNPFIVGSIGSPTYGCIAFPNVSVFPALDLTGIAIGTGDGAQTHFDVRVPWFVEGSESVYVDGVLVPDTDYTIDCHAGCEGARYPYLGDNPLVSFSFPSVHYYCTPESGDSFAAQGVPGMAVKANGSFTAILEYTYPITASRIFLSDYIDSGSCSAYVSDNGVDWTLAGQRGSEGLGDLVLDDTFTSKWWKVSPYCRAGYPDYIKLYPYYNAKGLVFSSPPAAGKAITMDCSIDRPIKNENWILDYGFSVQFSRG